MKITHLYNLFNSSNSHLHDDFCFLKFKPLEY